MNLEKLNLVELDAQEVQETEGGFFGIDDLALMAVGALVGALFTQDLDSLANAYNQGYNSTQSNWSGASGSW
jgi:hypothetical protein